MCKKEIGKIIDDLAGIEFADGKHKWATIEPKLNEITNPKHLFLDSLARFFTGSNDICVAVYLEKERLIIANNWRRSNYAERCLGILQKIVNNEEPKKIYKDLVWLIISEQIYNFTEQKVKEKEVKLKNMTREEAEAFNKLLDFKKKLWEYRKRYYEKSSLDEQLSNLKVSIDELFRVIGCLEEENKLGYWRCFSPLEDLNVIFNAVDPCSNSRQEWVVKIIENNQVKIIEGELCESIKEDKKKHEKDENYKDYETCANYRSRKIDCEICEKNVIHAEMKIINDIFFGKKKGNSFSDLSEMDIDENSNFEYIGISKLTCLPCHIAINILNPSKKESCVRGTHGSVYKSWVVPDNISGDNKREMLGELKSYIRFYEKGSESTCRIPLSLTEVNLEQVHQEQQIKSQQISSFCEIPGSSKTK